MSLFANKSDSLTKSLERRAKLVKSLTSGEIIENDFQNQSKNTQENSTSKRPRTITWSGSSPMKGFDLQQSASTQSHQIQARSHLIIKLKPAPENTALKKLHWFDKNIYLPRDESDTKYVLGHNLIQEGIHPLVVSWNIPMDYEFNMKLLFGTSNDIPLDQLTSLAPR